MLGKRALPAFTVLSLAHTIYSGTLPRPVLFVHGYASDAGTWGIVDAQRICHDPAVFDVAGAFGTSKEIFIEGPSPGPVLPPLRGPGPITPPPTGPGWIEPVRLPDLGNPPLPQAHVIGERIRIPMIGVTYRLGCVDEFLFDTTEVYPLNPQGSLASLSNHDAPANVHYDASCQCVRYEFQKITWNMQTGKPTIQTTPGSLPIDLAQVAARHEGEAVETLLHARVFSEVSAYKPGSAPDVFAKRFNLDVAYHYPDIFTGINHNGLYFYNAHGAEPFELDGFAPLERLPDGNGQTDQLYARMVEVLDDFYGPSAWENDPNAQIDII